MKNIRIIAAIFCKQLKDISKNTQVLVLFLIFPIISYVMTTAMADQEVEATFFISIFATMHAVFTPLVTSASIIAEEKEKSTLRVLILSNVKPHVYLLSIGGFVFLCTMLVGTSFLFMGSYNGGEAGQFMLATGIGCICSLILGTAIGAAAPNMMSANALAVPLGMLISFLPMLAAFRESIRNVSQYLYSQQVSDFIAGKCNFLELKSQIIIVLNAVTLVFAFVLLYLRNKKADS